jgi:hypothetical protein
VDSRSYRARDAQLLQMAVSSGQTNPLTFFSFYLSCQATVSSPSNASLLDEVFNLYSSSQRCGSRLKCVATRLFDRMREGAHENSIDVAALAALHDCCEHPAWPSIMACVSEVCFPASAHGNSLDAHTDTGEHTDRHTRRHRLRHRHTQVTRTQVNTKKRRMFFSEFCRLIQQVCSSLHNHIHLHGQQTGQKDTEQHQDKLPPVLHADGRPSSVCYQQAVAAHGHCMT